MAYLVSQIKDIVNDAVADALGQNATSTQLDSSDIVSLGKAISAFDAYNSRVFGFVSELLLDVWLEKERIAYHEQNVSFIEPQNWFKKGGSFLKRKVFGR